MASSAGSRVRKRRCTQEDPVPVDDNPAPAKKPRKGVRARRPPVWFVVFVLPTECLIYIAAKLPTRADVVYFASAHTRILVAARELYAHRESAQRRRWEEDPDAPLPVPRFAQDRLCLDWVVAASNTKRAKEAVAVHGLDPADATPAFAAEGSVVMLKWSLICRVMKLPITHETALAAASTGQRHVHEWLTNYSLKRKLPDWATSTDVLETLFRYGHKVNLYNFRGMHYQGGPRGMRRSYKEREVMRIASQFVGKYGAYAVYRENSLSLHRSVIGACAAEHGQLELLKCMLNRGDRTPLCMHVITAAAEHNQTAVIDWLETVIDPKECFTSSTAELVWYFARTRQFTRARRILENCHTYQDNHSRNVVEVLVLGMDKAAQCACIDILAWGASLHMGWRPGAAMLANAIRWDLPLLVRWLYRRGTPLTHRAYGACFESGRRPHMHWLLWLQTRLPPASLLHGEVHSIMRIVTYCGSDAVCEWFRDAGFPPYNPLGTAPIQ